MINVLICLSLIMSGLILLYNRASLAVWSVSLGVGFGAMSLLSSFSLLSLFVIWLSFIGFLCVFNIKSLRIMLITGPIFRAFKTLFPTMSDTEKEAIEAGTVGFEGELFSGAPSWHRLSKIHLSKLTPEEQAFIDGPTDELCSLVDEWEITHSLKDIPKSIWEFLGKNKFYGMIIPKTYGGLEFSATAVSKVVAKLYGSSVTVATTVSVPNSLGPGELLLKYGTDEQKNEYLPKLVTGEHIPCFALTGPTAGSDAASIPDVGIVVNQKIGGKDVPYIRINWDKRYITLAPVATIIGLAFKLRDPDGILGDKEDLGITCALIPRNTKGVTIGRRHLPIGTVFQNGPIQGKDVLIPVDWVIGGEPMIGKGWRMLMECLGAGRAISLPSSAMGGSKAALYTTSAYARIRQQFNVPIGKFEGISLPLAEIGMYCHMINETVAFTAGEIDAGEKPSVASAISKYHTTELSRKIGLHAMDIQAGKAVCLGPKNYMAHFYQSSPVSITVEGANILTRSLIIFGQGLIRCHPHVLGEIQAVEHHDLKKFDTHFMGHMSFMFSSFARTLLLGLTDGRLAYAPKKETRYYQRITRFSSALAFISECAMATLGGSLKKKESLSARLGDVLSALYMASALLKGFEDKGYPNHMRVITEASVERLLFLAQQALSDFISNFPNRFVGIFAKIVIFPLGRRLKGATDKQKLSIAKELLYPSLLRENLTDGIYKGVNGVNTIGLIEKTMAQVIASEPLEKKIKKARKEGIIEGDDFETLLEKAHVSQIITDAEKEQLSKMHEARMNIIHVDDFDKALKF